MLRLFQTLSKKLSIKAIVILGIGIMALIILGFALTMNYLSSNIKYDQDTLKTILNLEKFNQEVLNDIKNINRNYNEILLAKNSKELYKVEDNFFIYRKSNYEQSLKIESERIEQYNKYSNDIKKLLENQINLQYEIFEYKGIILRYKEELEAYKNKIFVKLEKIELLLDTIKGKAALQIKKLERKNKLDELNDYKNIIYITLELEKNILSVPNFIQEIINAENIFKINNVKLNKLTQNIYLFENNLNLLYLIPILSKENKTLDEIKSYFTSIKSTSNFIFSNKKLYFDEENELKKLFVKMDEINNLLLLKVSTLNDISKNIKIDILNHSDSISQKSTTIIIAVGLVFLLMIILAGFTLISRINIPLQEMLTYIDNIVNKKRDLESKLPILSNDEFGKLSISFNNMISTINKNIKKIKVLYTEIENTQKEVIFTMGAIGETRSKETGNHVKRVALYSKLLALKYGLNKKEAELLKNASPMHDIGKVGIPDSILKKPVKLNEEEWQIMKTHAQLGYEMLKHSKRPILKAAAIVAYEHHEKWDGTGYPRALKGEEIHIYGRITAIADVFDALGSDRCYKKAWPLEDIKSLFIEQRGKHFDPKLVEILFENLDEILKIRDTYKDV